jgi:hypothetical protein
MKDPLALLQRAQVAGDDVSGMHSVQKRLAVQPPGQTCTTIIGTERFNVITMVTMLQAE